jgi:hypothetical protein
MSFGVERLSNLLGRESSALIGIKFLEGCIYDGHSSLIHITDNSFDEFIIINLTTAVLIKYLEQSILGLLIGSNTVIFHGVDELFLVKGS